MSTDARTIHLDVTVRKDSAGFIAHCLQADIVATGKTQEEALQDLKDLIVTLLATAIENDNLESFWYPAPPEAWQSLAKCEEQARQTFSPVRPAHQQLELDTFRYA